MNLLNTIVKKVFVISILFIVGITMSFGVMTDDVAAASKKPSKVKITSIQSYDYNAIKITWKKATNAKKYQVYRASSKNGTYKLIKTTTSRSYINKSLTTGKKYYYKIRAVNGSKKGSFSDKKYATPTLKKTYGVKATANNYNTVTVSWNKVNGAKGYILYRATSKNGTYKKVKSTTASSYKVTGLTTGKTYYYKVRAYRYVNNKCKYGKYSAVVSKTTALSAPKAAAQLNSENQITVSWNKVSGAEKYKVYRATSSNGNYTAVKTTQLTSYIDTSAKASTKYYYKVKAVRGDYLSSYSNTVNCKWEVDLETIRTTMLDLINKERIAAGVEPIEMHEPLHCTAQEKAEDLYTTGVFDHYSDNLGWFYDQYEKAGITYYGGGENIAYGQPDVTSVMESWMQSKGHKANILDENWTHVGVGYYKGNWVQQFIESPYKEESEDTGEENKPVVGTCTCEAKSRAIQLIWDPIDGVDEYEVWRATELDGEYECIVDGLMSPNWYDNYLTPGQTYYYKIYAEGYTDSVYTPNGTVPALTHDSVDQHDWKPVLEDGVEYTTEYYSSYQVCSNCYHSCRGGIYDHLDIDLWDDCGGFVSGGGFTVHKRVDTGEYATYFCGCGATRVFDLQ